MKAFKKASKLSNVRVIQEPVKKVKKSDKCSDVPVLPGVKTFPEVAQMLGVSPQAINQMYHNGAFRKVYRVGTAVLVLRDKEVGQLIASRQAR